MISLNPETISERDNYKFLVGSIIPRPIALVTTLPNGGIVNAAPFSYFNIVSSNPPLLSVSIQRKAGIQKDTARNAIEKGEFVIHITDENIVAGANETAAELPPEKSELERTNLTLIESERITVPGIREAKIRFECKLEQAIPLGGNHLEPGCDLLIGRVICYHIAESLYQEGQIDALGLNPVARLAGTNYSKLGEQFSIERPK